MIRIPFNRPTIGEAEFEYVRQALAGGRLSGDGVFTKRCQALLESQTGTPRALLTNSGTAALELAGLLCDIQPGDEVIMPSYTFTSTANAFVLRGAVPVFVDIRPDTLNLDETLIEAAITPRTKAIVPVHYAGVGCDMDAILEIAAKHGLLVIEDASQAFDASYRGKPLGTFAQLGIISFHETKTVVCGEGGALLVNDPALAERAEIIREKGTNRTAFFRGAVDRYTWVDVGSSFGASDLTAAFLLAQLEAAAEVTARRRAIWDRYHAAFEGLEREGRAQRPATPPGSLHNGHVYYLVLPSEQVRSAFIARLREQGIATVFHFVPLHSSPAGQRFGRVEGPLDHTEEMAGRLVRLPLFAELGEAEVERVIEAARAAVIELT